MQYFKSYLSFYLHYGAKHLLYLLTFLPFLHSRWRVLLPSFHYTYLNHDRLILQRFLRQHDDHRAIFHRNDWIRAFTSDTRLGAPPFSKYFHSTIHLMNFSTSPPILRDPAQHIHSLYLYYLNYLYHLYVFSPTPEEKAEDDFSEAEEDDFEDANSNLQFTSEDAEDKEVEQDSIVLSSDEESSEEEDEEFEEEDEDEDEEKEDEDEDEDEEDLPPPQSPPKRQSTASSKRSSSERSPKSSAAARLRRTSRRRTSAAPQYHE